MMRKFLKKPEPSKDIAWDVLYQKAVKRVERLGVMNNKAAFLYQGSKTKEITLRKLSIVSEDDLCREFPE